MEITRQKQFKRDKLFLKQTLNAYIKFSKEKTIYPNYGNSSLQIF